MLGIRERYASIYQTCLFHLVAHLELTAYRDLTQAQPFLYTKSTWFQGSRDCSIYIIPGIEALPGFLNSLLWSDVEINVLASPANQNEVNRNATIITVGSPCYNRASQYVETTLNAPARFVNDNRALQLGNAPPVTDSNCGFVQKAVDQTTGQIAFYVAGPSIMGTTGAAFYHAKNWKQLSRRYPKHRPFCIMLRITSQDAKQHEILYER